MTDATITPDVSADETEETETGKRAYTPRKPATDEDVTSLFSELTGKAATAEVSAADQERAKRVAKFNSGVSKLVTEHRDLFEGEGGPAPERAAVLKGLKSLQAKFGKLTDETADAFYTSK